MIINPPCMITSRLLPGIKVGDGIISIEYSARPAEQGRTRYKVYFDIPAGEFIDETLKSGVGKHGLQDGLASLFSFLGVAADRYHKYNTCETATIEDSLFSKEVMEWAYMNEDEIDYLTPSLEEDELIKE